MYAIIEFMGKQHKAIKGQTITVDALDKDKGTVIDIAKVMLVSDEGKVLVGQPYVSGAKVTVEVGDNLRAKKVLVYKHKSKKDYHKMYGHRQYYTDVIVKDIVLA